jgi:hypothetical protein
VPFSDEEVIAGYLADTSWRPPPEQLAFAIGARIRPDRREYYREYNAKRDREQVNATARKRYRQKHRNRKISEALQRKSLEPFRKLMKERRR